MKILNAALPVVILLAWTAAAPFLAYQTYLAWFKPERYIAMREATLNRRPMWLKKLKPGTRRLPYQYWGHPRFAMYAIRMVGPILLCFYLGALILALIFLLTL